MLCRPEMVVGWYHSHPGFGCWLSGVDINTQQVWLTLCMMTAPIRLMAAALGMLLEQLFGFPNRLFGPANPEVLGCASL